MVRSARGSSGDHDGRMTDGDHAGDRIDEDDP